MDVSKADAFRDPTALEHKQMEAAEAGGEVLWKCRGCTTKFSVMLEESGLVVGTWHYFGPDLFHASKYWPWLVRREAYNLGKDKRNSEFWYQTRNVPDFKIQQ